MDAQFKHVDLDSSHDQTLTLHDCISDRVTFSNGILRFSLPNGFWVYPAHCESNLTKVVRTDAALVEFSTADLDDIRVSVFFRSFFKKTMVEYWDMCKLMNAINEGHCTLEFCYQYRGTCEQLWVCGLHFAKKPYYRECQLHLPGTKATFYWNNLRPDHEW